MLPHPIDGTEQRLDLILIELRQLRLDLAEAYRSFALRQRDADAKVMATTLKKSLARKS